MFMMCFVNDAIDDRDVQNAVTPIKHRVGKEEDENELENLGPPVAIRIRVKMKAF